MTLRYLLDTNVLSEPAKPRPNSAVVGRLRTEQGRIAMAAQVWNELIFGVQRLPISKRRLTLETYVRRVLEPTIPILPYDARAAEWHALERARLTSVGKTPAYVDGSIAAVAHTNQLILVTRNVSNYEDFQDLRLEDWTESKGPRSQSKP
jgi:tRNA(fMet)-specific endonuclease VapC